MQALRRTAPPRRICPLWVLPAALAALLTGCATPQDGSAEAKPGLVATVTSAVSAVNPMQQPGKDKPVITTLAAAPYQPSSMAVGEEKDLARERGQALGFVRQRELEAHLNELRARLLAASGVTQVPGRVMLRANPAFAASSSADGNIYLSIGWLPYLGSDDELAAIIAHELAHVLLRHHSTDIVGDVQKRGQSLQELGLGAKMALNKSGVLGAGDTRSLLAVNAVVTISDKLVMPAWGRKQEREADLLGIDLLVRAGFAPPAMTTMLEKQREWEVKTKESDASFDERVNQAARTDLGKAMAMSFSRSMEQVSSNHPDTGERIDATADYIDRYYADQAMRASSVATWNTVKARPVVLATTRAYDLSFSAAKLLKDGKAQDAYRYARQAAVGPTLNDAYPNWILAKSAQAVGKNAESLSALQRAMKSSEPVAEIYDAMIDMYEQRRDYANALQWTDKAIATFGDSQNWTPTKIRLLRASGRAAEATTLTLECSVKTPAIRQKCQEANGSAAQQAAVADSPLQNPLVPKLAQPLQPVPTLPKVKPPATKASLPKLN